MAFTTPTLQALVTRISDDLDARFPSGIAKVQGSLLYALARVEAATAYTLHRFGLDISRQILPSTASGEWLDLHGAIRGLSRNAAVAASGTAEGRGTGTIPTGTLLVRADGAQYATTAERILSGTPASVSLQAVEPGVAGNLDAGGILTFVSPISGVDSEMEVEEDGLTGGAEAEGDTAYRARILARWRSAPAGGTLADWESWALDVDGVARAWIDSPNAGSVRVVAATDDPDNPVPSSGVLEALETALETHRPVTMTLLVVEATTVEVDFGITVYPNTTAVKDDVESELKSLLHRRGEPGGRIYNSEIREAISSAAGEEYHTLTSVAGGGSGLDLEFGDTELGVLGTVTWG